MAQGPTNVNLIATYIHNNPGCRRVDLKRMLHKAATGELTDKQHDLWRKNQYFQRWGPNDNVYLDRFWYNELDENRGSYSRHWRTHRRGWNINYTRKSSYQLTCAGTDKVWPRPLVRPFEEGSLVEWQHCSPNNKRGWRPLHQGLVIERSDLYGLWVLGVGGSSRPDGKLFYVSHQSWVRRVRD